LPPTTATTGQTRQDSNVNERLEKHGETLKSKQQKSLFDKTRGEAAKKGISASQLAEMYNLDYGKLGTKDYMRGLNMINNLPEK